MKAVAQTIRRGKKDDATASKVEKDDEEDPLSNADIAAVAAEAAPEAFAASRVGTCGINVPELCACAVIWLVAITVFSFVISCCRSSNLDKSDAC